MRDFRSAIGAGTRRDYDVRLAFFMSLEIHAMIHFLWLQKFSNVAISRNIDPVDREGIIWLRTIQNGRTVSRKAITASKTSSDRITLVQPNIVMPFVHYETKIRICYRIRLLAFLAFTKLQ
jgi:hypothetical protein